MNTVPALAALLLLLLAARISPTITIIESNSQIKTACSSAPAWKLNLCNMTCSSCSTDNSDQCTACDSEFTLASKACSLSNSTSIFTYYSLVSKPVLELQDVRKFTRDSTANALSLSDTVYLCSTDNYRFQMAGLFDNLDTISLHLSFTETMQSVTLKFNLLVLVNITQLVVSVKGDERVTIDESTYYVADATGNYAASTNTDNANYLSLPFLSAANVRTTIRSFSANYKVNFKTLYISLNCATPGSTEPHWGFSDMVILIKQCETCVTTAVQKTIDSVAMLLLYALAGVAALLGVFFCLISIGKWRKKIGSREMNEDKDSIPLKAINRIITSKIGKKNHRDPAFPDIAPPPYTDPELPKTD